MQTYVYEGRNKMGERMRGRIDSASPQAVARWMTELEIFPTRIRELPRPVEPPEWMRKLTGETKVPPLELQMLTRQLANMVRAGMPLLVAIEGIQRATDNKALAKILLAVRNDLDRGSTLSQAMAQHPQVFDDFYVNMVRVGEESGKLDQAFMALFQQIAFDREIRRKVKSATRYPTFVLTALAIGVLVMMMFVVPVFARTYKSMKAELPDATKAMIWVSEFMRDYWWLLAALAVLGVMLVKRWIATTDGRYTWDRAKTQVPVIGKIIAKSSMARFCRNFAMAMRSGVPLVPAMELAARVTGNAFYEQRIMQMRRGVERGESFIRVATATEIFSALELQMIGVGEATGEVEEMMEQIAQIHSEDVDYEVGRLSETMEPLLLGLMGVLVGALLFGVFLPLWNLGEATFKAQGGG